MADVIKFAMSIIKGIKSIISMLGDATDTMGEMISAMPAIVVAPMGAGLAILVVYVIIHRGS